MLRSSGQALIRIREATAPTFRVALSGAGTVSVADGTIGSLTVESSGAARIDVGGTTGDASLFLSGAGGVRIAHLTGSLRRTVSGAAVVEIGR